MKDIRVDDQGRQRCWNCGGLHFTQKRTARAKVAGGTAAVLTFGVAGAAAPLVTKKKLKCQSCGEYNDVGSAKPYTGAANKRAAKKAGTDAIDPQPATAPEKVKPAEVKGVGRRIDADRQFGPQLKAVPVVSAAAPEPVIDMAPEPVVDMAPEPPPPPPMPAVPAGWYKDPAGCHELRFWDGFKWSAHVANAGIQAADPLESA